MKTSRHSILVGLVGLVIAQTASAQPAEQIDAAAEHETLNPAEQIDAAAKHETVKPRRHHVRMALELATIFAVGNRWYWRDNGKPNEVDWQLPFDHRALEAKLLSTDGWRFDGNEYYINALGHPAFGMLTTFLARENGYGLGESFLISSLASGTWEVFLEFAEYGSLNDLAMTSPAGLPLGESAYQIVHHLRETHYELRGGAGNENGASFAIVSARADLDQIPKVGDGTFRAGKHVGLAVEMPFDTGVRSIEAGAKTTLAGYYRNRESSSLVAGVSSEFNYRNQFARPEREWDLQSTVAVGPSVDIQLRQPGVTVDLGADLYADFALVKSEAFSAWRSQHPSEVLRNVMMKDHPYYYAGGATVDPRINVSIHDYHVGGKLAASLFESFDGHDRDQEMKSTDLHFEDHEARAEAWMGYDLGDLSVVVDARATGRGGSVAGVKDGTAEHSMIATLGYRI